jgi:hypothetical protein
MEALTARSRKRELERGEKRKNWRRKVERVDWQRQPNHEIIMN